MLTLHEPGKDVWQRFLEDDECTDHPVVARWRRVLDRRAGRLVSARRATHSEPALRSAATTRVLQQGGHVLSEATTELRRRGFATVLADLEGLVFASYGTDVIENVDVRNGLQEGASWSETLRGTNG